MRSSSSEDGRGPKNGMEKVLLLIGAGFGTGTGFFLNSWKRQDILYVVFSIYRITFQI
jgi:hypothetical protein